MIKTGVITLGKMPTNIESYYPDAPATSKLLTIVQFPGNGEAVSPISLSERYGPLYFVRNKNWAPNDMNFIFIQTPYHGGTFGQEAYAHGFLVDAIKYVAGLPNVDAGKIFLTGLSDGCDHLMYYMQKTTDAEYIPIAGIIPMSMNMFASIGNSPNDKLGGPDHRFDKCPIYSICGNADSFLTQMQKFAGYATDPTRQSDTANPVKLTIKGVVQIKGAHTGEWNLAYDNTGVKKADGTTDTAVYDWARSVVSIVAPPIILPPP